MTTVASNVTTESLVKELVESATLNSVPSQFKFANDNKATTSDILPILDYQLLTNGTPDQRSKVLRELAIACEEWGFFELVNHGIPETLLKSMIEETMRFFELPEEDKRKYETKYVLDPIRAGTACVITRDNIKINLWRDYVTAHVHPKFHCPDKPESLRETVYEYSEKSRVVLRKLLEAISENLGLENGYMDEMLKLDSHFQIYAANCYPPCPNPDEAIGIPPHTDPGLLSFVINNGVDGHQILHNGEWFNADCPQSSILVNIADHIQIFSNGRYKSVKHRAVVNTEATRISVVLGNGPAPDAIVSPAAPLVERDGRPLYRSMKFFEYMDILLSLNTIVNSNLEGLKMEID